MLYFEDRLMQKNRVGDKMEFYRIVKLVVFVLDEMPSEITWTHRSNEKLYIQ